MKIKKIISVAFTVAFFSMVFAEKSNATQFETTEIDDELQITASLNGNLNLRSAPYNELSYGKFGYKKNHKAQKATQSAEHQSNRPRPYTPPPSGSRNPQPQAGTKDKLPTSDMSAVANTPKPPLFNSLKNQHHSFGFWEMGVAIATSHSLTDVEGSKGLSPGDFTSQHFSSYNFGGGFYGRYVMNDWFSVKLGMNYVRLDYTRESPVQIGSIFVKAFKNDIFEFFGTTEFHLPLLANTPWDLYTFTGIGVFFSDVSLNDQNNRLITITDDFNQVQPFIPLGVGFSVKLTNSVKLGYEFGWRNTIFHYLDGVKADERYDHYFLNSIKIGFLF